jgi:Vitamin B6 photo-protection and homoeostasis
LNFLEIVGTHAQYDSQYRTQYNQHCEKNGTRNEQMKKTRAASSPAAAPARSTSSSSSFILRIREYEEDPSINTGTAWREYVIHRSDDIICKSNNEEVSATATAAVGSSSARATARRWLRAPLSVAKDLFLPVGYPASVRDGYIQYQLYDSIQGLCSYLRAVLCSAQVLHASGVGNAQATALGAALAWAQKDGAAMLGGLIFSYLASPQFDGHVKEFRLFADVINDVAMILDMWTPYYCRIVEYTGGDGSSTVAFSTRRLLYISSLSSLCKTMCGMSAGATKSSITQYFAIHGNLADLNATEATQETLMSLVGMLLGATLASCFMSSSVHINSMPMQWTIFTVLTLVHVWANYQGVALLRLLTLNRERTEVILTSIIQHQEQQQQQQQQQQHANPKNHDVLDNNDNRRSSIHHHGEHETEDEDLDVWIQQHGIPKPCQVFESMWSSTLKMLWPSRYYLHLNTHRLTDLVALDPKLLMLQDDEDKNKNSNNESSSSNTRYVLTLVGNGPWKQRRILVCLLTGANNQDELQAFCHAFYLRHLLLTTTTYYTTLIPDDANTVLAQNRALVQVAAQAIQPWFEINNTTTNNKRHINNNNMGNAIFYESPSTLSGNPTSHYGMLMRALVRQGWDVQGRLYLGFSRRRSQWSRTKEE